MAVIIPKTSSKEQESSKREQIGIHDPSKRSIGKAQIRSNRWQCNVYDGRIEYDHEIPETKNEKRNPPGLVCLIPQIPIPFSQMLGSVL